MRGTWEVICSGYLGVSQRRTEKTTNCHSMGSVPKLILTPECISEMASEGSPVEFPVSHSVVKCSEMCMNWEKYLAPFLCF